MLRFQITKKKRLYHDFYKNLKNYGIEIILLFKFIIISKNILRWTFYQTFSMFLYKEILIAVYTIKSIFTRFIRCYIIKSDTKEVNEIIALRILYLMDF